MRQYYTRCTNATKKGKKSEKSLKVKKLKGEKENRLWKEPEPEMQADRAGAVSLEAELGQPQAYENGCPWYFNYSNASK